MEGIYMNKQEKLQRMRELSEKLSKGELDNFEKDEYRDLTNELLIGDVNGDFTWIYN